MQFVYGSWWRSLTAMATCSKHTGERWERFVTGCHSPAKGGEGASEQQNMENSQNKPGLEQ